MPTIDTAILAVEPRDREPVRLMIEAARPDIALRRPEDGVPPSPGTAALIAFTPPPHPSRFADVAWVHCAGAGADKLVRGLGFAPPLMTRTVGRMGAQIGEYVLAYILSDLQKFGLRAARQDAARWDKAGCAPRFLFDQRVLVLGTGGIGRGVAAALRALGANVDGVSRRGAKAAPFARVFAAEALPSDLSAYGAVVSALPATDATRGFVGERFLAAFDGALLISVGRGEAVDHDAVLRAVDGGLLRGAVLDVFEDEPLPSGSPLWRRPGVTVTPHVSGITRPEDIAEAFLTALSAIERGEQPPLVVDQAEGY